MKTLGKYEVLAELATGSMGVLYRGRDTMLDREVALKTIAGTGSLDPELKERFYREARSGARLHHPNVITVYELGEQDGLVFIALELLTGCDLRQFIAQRRPLPIAKKIEIMAAVCDGLHHAHVNGIVHRDIKPSNIFLTDTNVPKILDFGVARLSASKLTVVGRVLGTPFYMAPEQIMGQPCDARSDLFSLAIVLFEFLTYAHPFAGDSIPKRIINDNPDSLLSHNPDLPPDLDSILFRALAKDPSQRYQSVDELAQALRAVAQENSGIVTQTQTQAPPISQPPVTREQAPPVAEETPQYANTEYKMSAILLALQEFDSAVDQQNVPLARAALATVEKLAKLDDRFATAAKESRTRLHELEARMPPVPEPVRPPTPVYRPQPVVEQPPGRNPAPTPPRTPAPTPPRTAPRTPPPMDVPRAAPVPPPYYETRPRPPADVPPPDVQQGPPSSVGPAPPESSVDDVTSMFRVPDLSALPRQSTIPPSPPPATPPRTTPPPLDRRSAPPVAPTIPERRSIPPSYAPPAPPATPPMASSRPPSRPATLPPYARPTVPMPPPPQTVRPPDPNKNTRLLLIVAAAGAILILVAVLVWLFTRNQSAARVPAEATAQVAAAQASIFESPSDDAAEVVALKKGDTVAVIRPPRSRSQEWIEVQYAAGSKVYPVGAMHTADLGNWTSTKPDVALALIQTYAPGDGSSDAELRAYANRLTTFMQQFSAPEQRAAAQAELNRINGALAHTDASPATDSGTPHNPSAARATPTPPPARQGAAFDVDAAMARAQQYWENGDYAQAETQLKRILQYRPTNQAAKKLLERVERAKQLESAR